MSCKGHFRPSATNPDICKWWITPPKTLETTVVPFCCCSMRLGKDCPSGGFNPYPTEEDDFE